MISNSIWNFTTVFFLSILYDTVVLDLPFHCYLILLNKKLLIKFEPEPEFSFVEIESTLILSLSSLLSSKKKRKKEKIGEAKLVPYI
jgi:hypothetical protein